MAEAPPAGGRGVSVILASWAPRIAIWTLILVVGERVAAHRGYSLYVVVVLVILLGPVAVFAGLLCSPRRGPAKNVPSGGP